MGTFTEHPPPLRWGCYVTFPTLGRATVGTDSDVLRCVPTITGGDNFFIENCPHPQWWGKNVTWSWGQNVTNNASSQVPRHCPTSCTCIHAPTLLTSDLYHVQVSHILFTCHPAMVEQVKVGNGNLRQLYLHKCGSE